MSPMPPVSGPSPFVVAVDIDEVLAQYLRGYCAYYNSVHGTWWQVKDFHTYKFWKVTGGTQDEAVRQVYLFHDSPYFSDLEVIPGAKEGVAALAALPEVELHIVTSRHAEIAEASRQWIARHFPGVFGDRIHIGNHWGTSEAPKLSKPEMCEKIGAEVLIDDSAVYCKEAAEHGIHTVLFDWQGGYGWSQERVEGPRCVRALSWPDVVAHVRQTVLERRGGPGCAIGPAPVQGVPFPPPTQQEAKAERECTACQGGACVAM